MSNCVRRVDRGCRAAVEKERRCVGSGEEGWKEEEEGRKER